MSTPTPLLCNMTLSVKLRLKRDFDLMTPWSDVSDPLLARAQKRQGGRNRAHRQEASATQEVPRRLTRALARKLQEESPVPVQQPQALPIPEERPLQVKKEATPASETASQSPPCMRTTLQATVKEEPMQDGLPSTVSSDVGTRESRPVPSRPDNLCPNCMEPSAVRTTPHGSGRRLCDECAAIEKEMAEQVRTKTRSKYPMSMGVANGSPIQQIIDERNQRSRAEAILLPPPAKHKVTNPILETLNGKVPASKKRESANLLPVLDLDEPRHHFSSYQHRPRVPYPSPGNGPESRSRAGRPFADRPSFSRNFMRQPGGPPQFHPLRRTDFPGPYQRPVSRYMIPRPGTPRMPASRWPSHLLPSAKGNPQFRVVTLQDIKHRRSLLLDFREVALDLLEETSTVLNQLDKSLPKLAAMRKNASP